MRMPVMPVVVASTVPVVARRTVIELAVMANGSTPWSGRAAFAGQHESCEEDDGRTAHGGANERTRIGGGVLPPRF